MKKVISILCVLTMLVGVGVAYAGSTDIGLEPLWNRVFDSTNNAIQADVSGVVSPDSPFTVTDSNVI